MKIIVGHSSMDLDCIGSIVLAKYLFPDHEPVKSHLMHPAAKNLVNMYDHRLRFFTTADLKNKPVEKIVIVDTSSKARIEEYLHHIENHDTIQYEIFDHHPPEAFDIQGALVHRSNDGANTTQLGMAIIKEGIFIEPEDATIALTGIYADTGNFAHDNVTADDHTVASFLLSQGASMSLVKHFLIPLREDKQMLLFHDIISILEKHSIRGYSVLFCYLELEDDTHGFNTVVDTVFEVENADMLFCFFYSRKKGKLLVIGRNGTETINLAEIFSDFGGGGHRQAGSFSMKTHDGKAIYKRGRKFLEHILAPADCAGDIMSVNARTIGPDISLLEASKFLEQISHTGAPVLDSNGYLIGILTLRDIMKGRKGNQMHVPVKHYMSTHVVTVTPDTPIREIDTLLFEKMIGHLPVVKDRQIAGIITRSDLLNYRQNKQKHTSKILDEFHKPSINE
jgi:tRNA nucleotidyltransferase (CCA-adding enzyme)